VPYLLRRLWLHLPALSAIAYLGLPLLVALADSLVGSIATNVTIPFPANSCLYVDQGSITDTKWCNPKASDVGGLQASNNGSDVPAPATFLTNVNAAPRTSPVFNGNPPVIPAENQNLTGAVAATADFVKAQEFGADAAWINQDPANGANGTCLHIAHQPEKVTGINGRVTAAAAAGSTATIVKVPSGIAVGAAGTVALTQAPNVNLLADSSVNSNQTLTLVSSQTALSLAVGDAICVTSNGATSGNFTSSGGVITVAYVKQ
jgi:hypothetical protein